MSGICSMILLLRRSFWMLRLNGAQKDNGSDDDGDRPHLRRTTKRLDHFYDRQQTTAITVRYTQTAKSSIHTTTTAKATQEHI